MCTSPAPIGYPDGSAARRIGAWRTQHAGIDGKYHVGARKLRLRADSHVGLSSLSYKGWPARGDPAPTPRSHTKRNG